MFRLLLLSAQRDFIEQVSTVLRALPFEVLALRSGMKARHAFSLQPFDVLVLDDLLEDQSGLTFAEQFSGKSESFIMLFAEQPRVAVLQEQLLDTGVLVMAKPLDAAAFREGMVLLLAAMNRLDNLRKQKDALAQRLEEMKILNRAKLILMEVLKLNEEQAHKFIERQAMERRLTKRLICESIIQTYRSR